MQRVRRSEYNLKDEVAVTKLQKEVSFLKEVLLMKQKGTANDMSNKVILLQEENERLKDIIVENQQ